MLRAEPRGVHERRSPHPFAQIPPQLLKPRQVTGKLGRQRATYLVGHLPRDLLNPDCSTGSTPHGPPLSCPQSTEMVGTPIQKASKVVVPPLHGIGSRQTSIRWYSLKYSSRGCRSANSMRDAPTPTCSTRIRTWSRAEPGGARRMSRDRGTAFNTRAHSSNTLSFALQKLFRQPNVTTPVSSRKRIHRRRLGQRIVTPECFR